MFTVGGGEAAPRETAMSPPDERPDAMSGDGRDSVAGDQRGLRNTRLLRGAVIWRRLRRIAVAAVRRRMQTETAELTRHVDGAGRRRSRRGR